MNTKDTLRNIENGKIQLFLVDSTDPKPWTFYIDKDQAISYINSFNDDRDWHVYGAVLRFRTTP